MGQRGPQRKPGSVRWKREVRAQQKVTAATGQKRSAKSAGGATAEIDAPTLPTCPKWLSKPVAARWTSLVVDMAAAGVPLQQLDSRSIAVAAGYENDLADMEEMGAEAMERDVRLQLIRLKNSARKDLLAALIAIGGTPVARLRARISIEDKPKANDDPWSQI